MPAGNRYGLPEFYELHAWIWRPEPAGHVRRLELQGELPRERRPRLTPAACPNGRPARSAGRPFVHVRRRPMGSSAARADASDIPAQRRRRPAARQAPRRLDAAGKLRSARRGEAAMRRMAASEAPPSRRASRHARPPRDAAGGLSGERAPRAAPAPAARAPSLLRCRPVTPTRRSRRAGSRELGQDVLDVGARGLGASRQLLGDLGVRQPGGDQPRDLELADGQRRTTARPRRRARA